jgi:hypothetical protein
MNIILNIGALLMVALICAIVAVMVMGLWNALHPKRRRIYLANVGEGRHANGVINRKADAAITERYRIVKVGSDANHIAITTAITDIPLGVCLDEPAAAETNCAVQLLNASGGTVLMRAAAAIANNDLLEATANGRVQTLTVTTGTHYCVGRALASAANAGDPVEVEPIFQKIVSP